HYVDFTYKEGRTPHEMKKLNEATLIEDFQEIREDYDKLDLGLFVLNCVSHVSLEGDQSSDFLFNLTGHTLRAVANVQNKDVLKLHFCLKFLYQQGVISLESWMTPFLKTNISDSNLLAEDQNIQIIVENYLGSIESMVSQYIKTADAGFA